VLRVSVITASRNCRSSITDCLDSVASQEWPAVEHIVVDGASVDGTAEILDARRSQFAFFESKPDNGIYDALNKGIGKASGDVVGFLHADDIFASPTSVSRIAAAFDDPSVCAVYGDLDYVSRDNADCVVRRWRSGPASDWKVRWGWMPPHPTLYVRRGWYSRVGGFDSRFRISGDYFSVLQLFNQPGFVCRYVPEVLVKMRLGGVSNKGLRNLLNKSMEDYLALRRMRRGRFASVGVVFCKNASKVGQFF
jgi:glycosyltransferase